MTPFSIQPGLLEILRCPESQQRLRPADQALVEQLNQRIAADGLRNHAGKPMKEKLDGGLVREDGQQLYALRHDIPIMLVDESIRLD